jgi:hypothetical protein
MASRPSTVGHVTSFAEIRARLETPPMKAQRIWHARSKHSYRPGQPCPNCGQVNWEVGRVTAECGGCGHALLLEHKAS